MYNIVQLVQCCTSLLKSCQKLMQCWHFFTHEHESICRVVVILLDKWYLTFCFILGLFALGSWVQMVQFWVWVPMPEQVRRATTVCWFFDANYTHLLVSWHGTSSSVSGSAELVSLVILAIFTFPFWKLAKCAIYVFAHLVYKSNFLINK